MTINCLIVVLLDSLNENCWFFHNKLIIKLYIIEVSNLLITIKGVSLLKYLSIKVFTLVELEEVDWVTGITRDDEDENNLLALSLRFFNVPP